MELLYWIFVSLCDYYFTIETLTGFPKILKIVPWIPSTKKTRLTKKKSKASHYDEHDCQNKN